MCVFFFYVRFILVVPHSHWVKHKYSQQKERENAKRVAVSCGHHAYSQRSFVVCFVFGGARDRAFRNVRNLCEDGSFAFFAGLGLSESGQIKGMFVCSCSGGSRKRRHF